VTNTYGQVWDTPNVFVTGAALFPQNSAYNPTGTVAALAYRTGDAMVKRYFRHPRELLD
jgi:gluconate 2-dehydrogenase alpha chain